MAGRPSKSLVSINRAGLIEKLQADMVSFRSHTIRETAERTLGRRVTDAEREELAEKI